MGDRRSPVGPRPAPGMEWAASYPPAPCPTRYPHPAPRPAAGAGDAAPPGGGPCAPPHQDAPAALVLVLVLVVGTGPARPGRGLAGVGRPLLDRAPRPFLQADAPVDHAQAAHPDGRRPLDLAPGAGLRPVTSGPRPSSRRALALAAAAAAGTAPARPRAPWLFVRPGTAGQSRQRAKTLRALARTPQRPALSACPTRSGGQTDPVIDCCTRSRLPITARCLPVRHIRVGLK